MRRLDCNHPEAHLEGCPRGLRCKCPDRHDCTYVDAVNALAGPAGREAYDQAAARVPENNPSKREVVAARIFHEVMARRTVEAGLRKPGPVRGPEKAAA